jgi:hypothetical protein
MAFHLPVIAGITSITAAGTFLVEKAQGKSNEEAFKSSQKVIGVALQVASLGLGNTSKKAK